MEIAMAKIEGKLTEEKLRAAMKGEGITSLDDLVRRAVEESNSARADEPNYFYSGKNYSWYHPE